MTKRKRKPRVRLYSSEALDLLNLPAKHREYARLFVHRLIARRIFDRRLKGREYVPMDSRVIRQYIPNRHVKPILDYLAETGQVEFTGYSEGHATRYRLSEELLRSRCLIYLPKSSFVARKLKQSVERQRKDTNARKCPVHHHLDHWLKYVRVEEKAAMQFVADNDSRCKSWLSSLGDIPLFADQLEEDRLHAEASIQAIHKKDWFSTVCKHGRYHSNITSFRKILRPFLRMDNKPLVEVDVSACQPLCLSIHLHEIRNNILTSVPLTEEQVQLSHQLSLFPVCCASGKEDDATRYQKDCESEKFYQKMQEICKVDDRSKLKVKLFAEVFFCKRRRGKLLDGFRRLYPTMGRLIDWVKRHDYKHLSHTLQRIESSIVINDACEVMRVQHPDVPILTIHDSILTIPAHSELVTDVLRSAFHRHGVSPNIRPKQIASPSVNEVAS